MSSFFDPLVMVSSIRQLNLFYYPPLRHVRLMPLQPLSCNDNKLHYVSLPMLILEWMHYEQRFDYHKIHWPVHLMEPQNILNLYCKPMISSTAVRSATNSLPNVDDSTVFCLLLYHNVGDLFKKIMMPV
jgi:hypothetical protein